MPQTRFSIKDIESLTGIKPHTIRIWEKRYGIPRPQRTETNIRFYFDEDLKLLLNVAILNRNGFKISKICCLQPREIEKLVLECSEKDGNICIQVEALIHVLLNLDEAGFEKVLANSIVKHGIQHTMTEVIFPFMQRIGVLWQVGSINPACEHFFSNLVRQKIITAIDGLHLQKKNAKKFVLFLPEHESHELCLLYANYLVRRHGHHSVYFGANLPMSHLYSMKDLYEADYMATSISSAVRKEELTRYLSTLSKKFPKTTILVSGQQVIQCEKKLPSNMVLVRNFHEMESFLKKI